MPRLLGFEDGESRCSSSRTSPDARLAAAVAREDIAAVLAALDEVAAAEAGRPAAARDDTWPGWPDVAADPEPFLGLGLVSREWLDAALPPLLAAASATPLDGGSLLHCDVRSDNLCIRARSRRPRRLESRAHRQPRFRLAFWLPSLKLEGGPTAGGFGVDEFARVRRRVLRGACRLAEARRGAGGSRVPARAARGCAAVGVRARSASRCRVTAGALAPPMTD